MGRVPPPDPVPAPPRADDPYVARARAHGLHRWPDVVADLAAGRRFAAHEKLQRLRRATPDSLERSILDAALADVRLFAEPVVKPPGLGRLNGIGTGMYGHSDDDPSDGSYVKTRMISVVWCPVIPLDRWLVRTADGGGWYFLARLPLGGRTRALKVAGVGALCVAAVALFALISNTLIHTELWLCNGLDVPATVTVDELPPQVVGPRSRVHLETSGGVHRFRCVIKGRVVDDRRADLHGWPGFAAYNVAGSAPLFVEDVVYEAEKLFGTDASKRPKDSVKSLAGRELVKFTRVRFAFEPASAEVSMSDRSKDFEVETRVDEDPGGWRAALARLEDEGHPPAIADFVEKLALAVPDDPDVVATAVDVSRQHRTTERHASFVERLAAAKAEIAKAAKPR